MTAAAAVPAAGPNRRRASSAVRPTAATAPTNDGSRTATSESPTSSTTCSSR